MSTHILLFIDLNLWANLDSFSSPSNSALYYHTYPICNVYFHFCHSLPFYKCSLTHSHQVCMKCSSTTRTSTVDDVVVFHQYINIATWTNLGHRGCGPQPVAERNVKDCDAFLTLISTHSHALSLSHTHTNTMSSRPRTLRSAPSHNFSCRQSHFSILRQFNDMNKRLFSIAAATTWAFTWQKVCKREKWRIE